MGYRGGSIYIRPYLCFHGTILCSLCATVTMAYNSDTVSIDGVSASEHDRSLRHVYRPPQSIPQSNGIWTREPRDAFSVLFLGKARTGLTFEQIAQAMNKDEVWVAALFYGQAKANEDELHALFDLLKLGSFPWGNTPEWLISELGPRWYPNRGIGPIPPTDPVIYRLFEGVLVYGHAIKAVIHEKFGDGIMSMIDCKIHVDKKEDPNGNRVVLTFDGKFLPYAKW